MLPFVLVVVAVVDDDDGSIVGVVMVLDDDNNGDDCLCVCELFILSILTVESIRPLLSSVPRPVALVIVNRDMMQEVFLSKRQRETACNESAEWSVGLADGSCTFAGSSPRLLRLVLFL